MDWTSALSFMLAVLGGSLVIQMGHPSLRAIPPAGWPGVALVAGPVIGMVVLRLCFPVQTWARALGSIEVALLSLWALMILALPAAIWPQGQAAPEWLRRAGLADIFSSLPFAVVLGVILLNLSSVCGARLRHWGWSTLPLVLLHAGLLLALGAAAAGSGSWVRGQLLLKEGAPASDRVVGPNGQTVGQLPLGLMLDNFHLRESSPRLVMTTGVTLEYSQEALGESKRMQLADLVVQVDEYLESAAIVGGKPVSFAQPGARPALRVHLERHGQSMGSGWLHPPSPFGEALFVDVGDGRSLLLEDPRPTYFASDIRLAGQAVGQGVTIEVNRPLHLGDWWCYQSGYDSRAGAASTLSVLDCVYDPSYPWLRLGLLMFLVGTCAEILQRRWQRERGAQP